MATVTRAEAPRLFESFEEWRIQAPHSFAEKRSWERVLELAEEWLRDDGTLETVEDVTPNF